MLNHFFFCMQQIHRSVAEPLCIQVEFMSFLLFPARHFSPDLLGGLKRRKDLHTFTLHSRALNTSIERFTLCETGFESRLCSSIPLTKKWLHMWHWLCQLRTRQRCRTGMAVLAVGDEATRLQRSHFGIQTWNYTSRGFQTLENLFL